MIYKVIEEFSGEEFEYTNLKEAYKEALNCQGVLVKIDENKEEIVLAEFI